jgi:predicted NBD/HSP70 family sugar kinase
MQALGSYEGDKMLFLGLGTGLGSAMIVDGALVPMELGHLPYHKDKVFENFVGAAGLKRHGKKKWASHVHDVVDRLVAALEPDYVVLGGGNADKLGALPKKSRLGKNGNAFLGGFSALADSRRRGWSQEEALEIGRARTWRWAGIRGSSKECSHKAKTDALVPCPGLKVLDAIPRACRPHREEPCLV